MAIDDGRMRAVGNRRSRLAPLVALVLLGAAGPLPPSPADLYGPLFVAVQQGRVFTDGKTFADAVAKDDAAAIMAAYRRAAPGSPAALRAFVERHFTLPPTDDPTAAAPPGPRAGLRDHVRALWPVLTRPAAAAPPGSSALGLPAPYVVPGGRFREIYYWDSYFTMLGLRRDGQTALVEAMLADFVDLIERYGHIPNGTRTYYLSRAQPPFFALMLDLAPVADAATERRRLAALRTDYAWWMKGAGCLGTAAACARVVRMPDGSLLNRYWDDRATPRDESFAEDSATAAARPDRPAAAVYRDLRAGAESGWDFSARWLADPARLASVRTTDVVPVDLNSLLWATERAIARRCAALGDRACSDDFAARAARRRAAIARWLWQRDEGRFADWSIAARAPTGVASAAMLYPLFVGLATPAQGNAVAATIAARFVAPGGLRTTLVRTGQQWDTPNGWAPLQWIAVAGLADYGHAAAAHALAGRWIATVDRTYRATGKMLEKYDVEKRRPGGGGEYPLQDGFGWTNGVTSALLDRFPDLDPDPEIPALPTAP